MLPYIKKYSKINEVFNTRGVSFHMQMERKGEWKNAPMREVNGPISDPRSVHKKFTFAKSNRKELFEATSTSNKICYDYDITKVKTSSPFVDFTRKIQRNSTVIEDTRNEIDAEKIYGGYKYLDRKAPVPNLRRASPRDDRMYTVTEMDRKHKNYYTIDAQLVILELKRKMKID